MVGVLEFSAIERYDQSSGNRLYALPDSQITAKYTDRTLPKPYNTNDDLDILVQEIIISNIPTSERLSMNELEILSQNGELIERLDIGQTGMLFSKVKNTIDCSQEFTYSVQIKNEDNNWMTLISDMILYEGTKLECNIINRFNKIYEMLEACVKMCLG